MWLGKYEVPSSPNEGEPSPSGGWQSPPPDTSRTVTEQNMTAISAPGVPFSPPEEPTPKTSPAKADKITEQALTRSIFSSVLSILVCMTCLIGLTWAWFTAAEQGASNTLEAGEFKMEITVTGDGVTEGEDGYSIIGAATVTLERTGCGKAGFCLVSIRGTSDSYSSFATKCISAGEDFSFTVNNDGGWMQIQLTPVWGVPSTVSILNGGNLSIGAKGPEVENLPAPADSAAQTEPPATEAPQNEP